MKNVRTETIDWKNMDWVKVNEYFKGYTHIDPEDVPEAYQDYVIPMKEILKKEAVIRIKYGITEVTGREMDRIQLEKGGSFSGKLIGEAYQNAEKIILYVVSVLNMEEILQVHPDLLETFFLEYWAVSILNAIREAYYDFFTRHFVNKEEKLTYIWSPGQSDFALSNQEALFALLEPEEIGVTLDSYTRMIPLKSVSATIGIVPKESEVELISCDYCEHARTCPGYKGKKYLAIGMEERRI